MLGFYQATPDRGVSIIQNRVKPIVMFTAKSCARSPMDLKQDNPGELFKVCNFEQTGV